MASPFFRPMLGNVVAHAWYHRELWPFAAVAGLAGIGAGINDVLTQARLASTLPGTDPLTSLASMSFIRSMLESFVLQGPGAVALTTLLLCFLAFLGAFVISWCQHLILRAMHNALTKTAPLSFHELMRATGNRHVVRILLINALVKILILNIILLSGILLATLTPLTNAFDAFFGIVFAVFSIMIAFGLNVWGMLGMILVVKKHERLGAALGGAWRMLKKHTLACLELSLLVFAITFSVTLLAIAGLIIIGSLSIPLFGIMVSQGTPLGFALVTFCTILLGTVFAVAAAGFCTLIIYGSWMTLAERFEKKGERLTSRISHHAKRTVSHMLK